MRTAIIGAGVSGLSLALLLDGDIDVFESSSKAGGHASTTIKDGWTFDRGPHIMFSKNNDVLNFMIASLRGNVHESKRNSKVCIAGSFVKYPIENDLAGLPEDIRNECLLDYLFNTNADLADNPENLYEWFTGVFGKALTERYFKPYNEKIWKTPIQELSMTWSERIPRPPAVDVVKGALGISTEGYVHQLHFHYPRRGGYEAIPQAWAALLRPGVLHVSTPVHAIEPTDDGVDLVTAKGRSHFDRVVSTVPLPALLDLMSTDVPDRLRADVAALRINPMAVITLGFRGVDAHQFSSVYFPDPQFLVHRISSPCTFSPFNGPEGCFSIQAEITAVPGDPLLERSESFFIDHCADGLLQNGVIQADHELVFSAVERFPYAYVVYDQGYEARLASVKDWFQSHGVHLHGRFGSFEYLNVDGCVIRSLELAGRLNGRATSLPEIGTEDGEAG